MSTQSDALREQVRHFMETTTRGDGAHVTQSDIARACGVSSATVNQWLSGQYPGNTDKLEQTITDFLKREEDKRIKPKVQFKFIKTRAAKQVYEVCRIAHLDNDIGVVCGEAGAGKTEAVRNYSKRQTGVILIEAHLGYTARNLFQELHRAVGYDGVPGSINRLFNDVVEKLRDSGRLIIIDEAEHLPYKALELLRRVHDKAGIGVVLVGMPRLVANLRGKKGEYAQLYSRVGAYRNVDALTLDDVRQLVAQIATSQDDVYEIFLSECAGNARVLTKLVNRSMRLLTINKKRALSAEIIREAKQTLLV